METLLVIIYVIGTLIIGGISRRSLLHPRSHGFFRFFAWEGILLLVLFNAPSWFDNPTSFRQICSWLLLTISLYPVAHGTFLLHAIGRPVRTASTGTNFAFEQTSNLVTVGIYKYIRHPLYASLFYLTVGIYLKDVTLTTTLITGLVSAFLFATAKVEEKENVLHFGKEYERYAASTKRFIPFVW